MRNEFQLISVHYSRLCVVERNCTEGTRPTVSRVRALCANLTAYTRRTCTAHLLRNSFKTTNICGHFVAAVWSLGYIVAAV